MLITKDRFFLFLTCLILTFFVLFTHVLPQVNTMINYVGNGESQNESFTIADDFLSWAVDYHKKSSDFKRRPITTFLIDFITDLFLVKTSIAFVCVNFFFLFLIGFLISYLGQLYGLSKRASLISSVSFYLSFSILFGFFIPIATYDEPVQYFLILISLIVLKKNKKILFVIFLSIAIIARDNTLIILPAILFFLLGIDFKNIFQTKLKTIFKFVLVSLPVVVYALYLFWFYNEYPDAYDQAKEFLNKNRFGVYEKNFRNIGNMTRTFLSLSSVCLFPIVILCIYKKSNNFSNSDKRLINAFWLTLFINTGIILLSVYAEESRVFALPLLFVFPIFGKILAAIFQPSKAFFKFLIHPFRLGLISLTSVFSWLAYNYLYSLTDINSRDNFYVEYNVCIVLIIMLIFLNRFFVRRLGV